MSRPSAPPRAVLYGAVAALAVGLGILAGALWLKPAAPELRSGLLLKQARALPAFALLDQSGQPFTPARLQGRWSLVFPGFTHCPDVCPTTLGLLKIVDQKLGADADRRQVLFLTVDPARDTPQALAPYVQFFSPRFTGVTGEAAEIDRMASALGIAYSKVGEG